MECQDHSHALAAGVDGLCWKKSIQGVTVAPMLYRFHSLLNRDVFGGGRGTSE